MTYREGSRKKSTEGSDARRSIRHNAW